MSTQRYQTYMRNCSKVHIAIGQLGMDEDSYRALLQRIAGVTSFAGLRDKPAKQRAVMAELKRLGWREKAPSKPGKRLSPPTHDKADAEPIDKLRALWIQLGREGVIDDASETALDAWVRRMTKGRIQAAAWLVRAPADAGRLIEAAKRWRRRVLNNDRNAEDGNGEKP